MRVFAPDRIKNMMGRLGIAEDEPIQNSLVSRAIENAQGKIEGLNFDMRKYLLEYDDVTNHQRQTIYDRRRRLLYGGPIDVQEFLDRAFAELSWTAEEKTDWRRKIEARKADLGEEVFWSNAKRLALQVIDMYWVEHLEAIEYMRNSVRLRAYGQRDPLVEFKKEGLRLFKEMEAMIFASMIEMAGRLGQEVKSETVQLQAVKEGAEEITSRGQAISHPAGKKEVGRNDPCPCGSGKKYKKCHGA